MAGTNRIREEVRRHRARLREPGLRPVQLRVPDVRSPEFQAEARRQSELVAASPHAADDMVFAEALAEGVWGAREV